MEICLKNGIYSIELNRYATGMVPTYIPVCLSCSKIYSFVRISQLMRDAT